jgi:predicted Zn-dependent protease
MQSTTEAISRQRGSIRWLPTLAAAWLLWAPAPSFAEGEHPLVGLLQSELQASMEQLVSPDGTRPYFLQYVVTDQEVLDIGASLGALTSDQIDRRRILDVDVRCGDYQLDNTHQIRDAGFFGFDRFAGFNDLPLDDDPLATRHAVWLATDEQFKAAVKRLGEVRANVKVKVEEEDLSDDFSREEPSVRVEPWLSQSADRAAWAQRLRDLSRAFRQHPLIFSSSVTLSGSVTNRAAVNSEGSKVQDGRGWWRVGIQASTIAEDGMELWQYAAFDAHSPQGLPDDATLAKGVQQLIDEVLALRAAPVVEPYTGPAILMNRAAGVFFHEIFGHRIEGHRQKDVEEGQTFAKKIGKAVLPDFLSVVDDPTQRVFNGVELNGYYAFDDELVATRPAHIVTSGVLETFLLSRSPTRGFTKSNGHGRRQPGLKVVARQGNLMVQSSKQISFQELRHMLVEQAKAQGKEYGLLFEDISGGFTFTGRFMPQAFKVLPIIVYRVYTDGRPDELVRGVDIVGTPLTCFSKILATANDAAVFNGVCGAESGMVPVSAIAPSMLVEQIEVEKKEKAQDRPPILPAPIASENK